MSTKTNDDVLVKFTKQQNKTLQFKVGNKFTNVIYGGEFSKTFRKAVRKQFKKQPFSLPQNIKSFAGMGINRAGNIVEFSKVAKKFQHSFKQKFKAYQIVAENYIPTGDALPVITIQHNGVSVRVQHIASQDFKETLSYVTKNGKRVLEKEMELIRQTIKNYFNGASDSADRLIIKAGKKAITKIKPMYHPALPTTIKGKSLIPDSKDVDFEQKWDTENGSCFYDYLLDRYGTAYANGKWDNKVPKELRILVQDRERLWEVMTGIHDYKNEHVDGDWSVNIDMIATLCKRYEISCYLINEADEFIFTYQNNHPKKKKIPPIYAMITNQHINPIVSDHKKKSLQHRLMGGKSKKKKEVEKLLEKEYEIVKVPFQTEENCDMFDILCEKSEETGKTPLPMGLRLDDFRIDGFILEDKKYIYDTEDNQMGELYAKTKKEKWKGTGIKSVAIKMFNEEHYLQSQLTPELYNLFTNKQVKDRSHRGFVNGEFILNKDVLGFDKNKAFTYCVINPYDDWYIMGFDSVWEKYEYQGGHHLENAFYYIETDDMMLFHQSNIYSRCIVQYGLKQKIITRENILMVLKPVKTQNKYRFKSLFDKYLNLCDERKVGKFCCNLMTGLLGRKVKKKMKARLSTNFQDVSKFYQENEGSQIFCKSSPCNDEELFIFGLKTEVPLINNHLPNYIQILDNMNIHQYKMMKTFMKKEYFGKVPIYRKVDMFCCDKKYLKNNWNSKLSNDMGGYKLEIPKILYNSSYKNRTYYFDDLPKPLIKINKVINDSNQIEEIKKVLFGSYKCTKHGNNFSSVINKVNDAVLMIEGDGGTGKTKIIQDLDKDYKCLKMSFTNKACININGTTYHRGLSLNKRLNITPSKFANIEKNYDMIICEEFSMNTSWIWNYICWLRELTTLPILLTGDWGQARPVEPNLKPKYDKYCFHPIVENLITNKIMLEKNYRAKDDLPFAKFLHDNKANMKKVNIDEFKLTDDKRFITKALCYLNSTRKRVNCEISEAVIKRQHIPENNIYELNTDNRKEEKVSFEVAWKDGCLYDDVREKGEDKNPTQNIRIFTGTPMIARMTEEKGKKLFNNEDFIIQEISKENVILKSLNRKDDHPLYEIPLKDLQTKFLVAWCLTTHKAQGQTIKEAFKIYDWDKMNTELRYTAMSRSVKKGNVFIEPVKMLFIGDDVGDDTDWETDDEFEYDYN